MSSGKEILTCKYCGLPVKDIGNISTSWKWIHAVVPGRHFIRCSNATTYPDKNSVATPDIELHIVTNVLNKYRNGD